MSADERDAASSPSSALDDEGARAALPAGLRAFDDATSPVKNPVGVFVAFNAVLVALLATLVALLRLGEDPKRVYGLLAASAALWLSVDAVLVRIWWAQLPSAREEAKAKAKTKRA